MIIIHRTSLQKILSCCQFVRSTNENMVFRILGSDIEVIADVDYWNSEAYHVTLLPAACAIVISRIPEGTDLSVPMPTASICVCYRRTWWLGKKQGIGLFVNGSPALVEDTTKPFVVYNDTIMERAYTWVQSPLSKLLKSDNPRLWRIMKKARSALDKENAALFFSETTGLGAWEEDEGVYFIFKGTPFLLRFKDREIYYAGRTDVTQGSVIHALLSSSVLGLQK